MKQLLVYISPAGGFDKEHEELTKIQIDNSLELGWKPEDIILVTNFDWGYKGVNVYVMKGDLSALDGNRSSKILAINQLFKDGMINDLFWFHDHDAFQLEKLNPDMNGYVAAFTDHGWSEKWNAGSFFFNGYSKDIFLRIYDTMIARNSNEQDALTFLWENGLIGYKMLNITYNLNIYHLDYNLKKADKPYLVAHFHPHKPRHLNLFRKLLPDRLLTIYKNYGIQ